MSDSKFPIHDNFQSSIPGGETSDFVNFAGEQDEQGFGGFADMPNSGTGGDTSDFASSTFQMFAYGDAPSFIVTISSSLRIDIPIVVESTGSSLDVEIFGPVDTISSTFQVNIQTIATRSASMRIDVPLVFESVGCSLSASIPIIAAKSFSLAASIPIVGSTTGSVTVSIAQPKTTSGSLAAQIRTYVPPPVTSIDDPLNPLVNTLYYGGFQRVSNILTDPGANPAKTPYVIGTSLAAFTSLNDCRIFEASVDLSRTGGRFSVFCHWDIPPPAIGSVFTIAGLNGTVEDSGIIRGLTKGTYIQGTIGDSHDLEKQILLASQTGILSRLAPGTNPTSSNWQTLSAVAEALGTAAGINIFWTAPDQPFTDTFAQSGTKIGSALSSLAGRAGAFLYWINGSSYTIATPDQAIGRWEGFPHCSLIRNIRGPFRHRNTDKIVSTLPIPDRGPGQLEGFDSSVEFVPLYTLFASPVAPIHHIWGDRKPPDENIPIYIDVPGNFNQTLHLTTPQTRCQIIIDPEDPSGTFTTTDPKVWGSISVPVIKIAGKDRFQITDTLFPPGVTKGVFNLGYVADTQSKEKAFRKAVDEASERRKLSNQQSYDNIRFFKEYSMEVEALFFGSVPLPGNATRIIFDDIDIDMLIENTRISWTKSGITLNLSLGKYTAFDLANPLIQMSSNNF